jgi:hypothetical protein
MKLIVASGRTSPAFANSISGKKQKERTSQQSPQ